MNEPTTIGDEGAARNLDRDGYPVLAAIHRLTPRQACDALAFLSGYAPGAVARALDHVAGTTHATRDEVTAQATPEHIWAAPASPHEGREAA